MMKRCAVSVVDGWERETENRRSAFCESGDSGRACGVESYLVVARKVW